MQATQIAFYVVEASLLLSGLYAVLSPKPLMAVAYLALNLMTSAIVFALLRAPLVSALQALVLVSIAVPLVISMTRRDLDETVNRSSRTHLFAAIVAAAFFFVLSMGVHRTGLSHQKPGMGWQALGAALRNEHTLALCLGVLLLVVIVMGCLPLLRKMES